MAAHGSIPITGMDELIAEAGKTTARTWRDIDQVPAGVAVTDKDGDRVFRSGNRFLYTNASGEIEGASWRAIGPFTEILKEQDNG